MTENRPTAQLKAKALLSVTCPRVHCVGGNVMGIF